MMHYFKILYWVLELDYTRNISTRLIIDKTRFLTKIDRYHRAIV